MIRHTNPTSINRNIVEYKNRACYIVVVKFLILIETLWNEGESERPIHLRRSHKNTKIKNKKL